MLKWIYIKTDVKKLYREPMMVLLFLTPLFMAVVFKLLVIFLVPFINNYISFDITLYHPYILSIALLTNPAILGTVMGFMMLDDKDGRIVELISVTPLGRSGYIILRLFFVFISVFFYTFYTYLIVGLVNIPIYNLLILTVLLSLYGSLIGIILFMIATDKVKGLTYMKSLNIIMLFAFADLINIQWIQNFSKAFPTYWITKIIMEPQSFTPLAMGTVVHLIWLAICLLWFSRMQKRS